MERRSIRVGSNIPHGATASSSSPTGTKSPVLPLVDYPRCGIRLISIRSKQPETYGQLFYLCPNNIKEDPRTCKFLRSHEQYVGYLRELEEAQVLQVMGAGHSSADAPEKTRLDLFHLSQGFDQMKQNLQVVQSDIGKLKRQTFQMELFRLAVALCVGVVIGVLVSLGLASA